MADVISVVESSGSLVIWSVASFVIGSVIFFGVIQFDRSYFRKVDQGFAMIVNTLRKEPTVTFTGALVLPVLHRVDDHGHFAQNH